MALLGTITRESYLKTSWRKRRPAHPYDRPRERQRITKVEKWVKGKLEQTLTVQYVDGTREPKHLELYSGKERIVIELQPDNTYLATYPLYRKVVNLKFNQRNGDLTWNEVSIDGTVGPEQICTIDVPLLSTVALLLFFPIGWFLIPFQPQLKSIAKSWNSLLDSFADAYSTR